MMLGECEKYSMKPGSLVIKTTVTFHRINIESSRFMLVNNIFVNRELMIINDPFPN